MVRQCSYTKADRMNVNTIVWLSSLSSFRHKYSGRSRDREREWEKTCTHVLAFITWVVYVLFTIWDSQGTNTYPMPPCLLHTSNIPTQWIGEREITQMYQTSIYTKCNCQISLYWATIQMISCVYTHWVLSLFQYIRNRYKWIELNLTIWKIVPNIISTKTKFGRIVCDEKRFV